jgi:hypothetical protein
MGGGYPRVPSAQNARNQELQNEKTPNALINLAKWDVDRASLGETVPFTVKFNRLPTVKTAVVEILFNVPNLPPQAVGAARFVPSNAILVNGRWPSKAPKSGRLSDGYFTFRISVDNQWVTSNKLILGDTPIVRVVQGHSQDSFEPAKKTLGNNK